MPEDWLDVLEEETSDEEDDISEEVDEISDEAEDDSCARARGIPTRTPIARSVVRDFIEGCGND